MRWFELVALTARPDLFARASQGPPCLESVNWDTCNEHSNKKTAWSNPQVASKASSADIPRVHKASPSVGLS